MPGSYLIDQRRGIVFSRAWGSLTDAEVYTHADTLRTDDRFDPTFKQLFDFLRVSELRISAAAVAYVARNNPFAPHARRAFVVANDEAFGLARMFELNMNLDGAHFRIFRELGPAFEWIALPSETDWPSAEPDKLFGVPSA